MEHFDTIHDSPSQIYHSALPSSPSSSWLHKYYSAGFLNEVEIVRGLSAEWGPCSRTIPLDGVPLAISYWKKSIAVGLRSGGIIILNVVTGSQVAVLAGHRNWVRSVTFSSDGKLLVSGSDDRTIKLWDVQTGGLVKTLSGHHGWVFSVCISADNAVVASGSDDHTICLWNIQTGECNCVIKQKDSVHHVSFLPMQSQYFISISHRKVQQWDTNGQGIGSEYTGSHVSFSLDGTLLVLCINSAVIVQDTKSGTEIAKFRVATGVVKHCCFSPDGRFIAASVGSTAHTWDITSPGPHLIDTFTEHSNTIDALVFSSPSSLISVSSDKLVKFWQIGASSAISVETDSNSATYHLAQAISITLQAKQGIVISSGPDGVVRIWDILTGNCKKTFQTPLQKSYKRDVQLIDSRLIIVWYEEGKIHIWDAEKQEHLFEVIGPQSGIGDLKISGDGSKVFCLADDFIGAWFIWTGKKIDEVTIEDSLFARSLTVEGSGVWAHYYQSEWEGWDFEFPDSPVSLSRKPPYVLHQNGALLWDIGLSRIQDTASGKVLFQLSAGLGMPTNVGWHGQYFVACFRSGKILVLDLNYVLP